MEDLRSAVRHHWEAGLSVALTPVVLPDRGEGRERWLTRQEAARLLRTARRMRQKQFGKITERATAQHVAQFILVGIYTGTRAGAICGAVLDQPTIGRSWIDLENGIFYRQTIGRRKKKNKQQTPVRLPPRLLAHLRRWKRKGISIRALIRAVDDPRIVSRLIGSGAEQAERRTLTVFFLDIKGFSGISEQLTAGAVVNLLNSYFGTVAGVIHDHRGFIDKYIGDAVMAFWIPLFSAGDDHAADACLAAIAQQEAMVALRTQLPEITGMRRNPPELSIRMGIATGEAVVGTIGSESTRSYAVIGDTVNLASRLESINKLYGSSIILSEDTYRLAQQVIEARELDLITVAGKTEPVRIYEAMSRAGELAPERVELRELFASGLAAYRRQGWDEARTQFESCLRIAEEDGPCRLFLERIALLRNAPPPADWNGIWRFLDK